MVKIKALQIPLWMVIMRWVLISKINELIGYTDDAVRAKIKKGVWLNEVHWIKAPDGRLMFNLEAIQKWIENKA